MTVIAGTFADFRIVKTRNIAQLIFEVPIEKADEALDILGGVPQPSKERWVGIAPIPDQGRAARETERLVPSSCHPAPEAASPSRGGEPGGAGQVASKRTPWRDMKIVTRAAMMCEDARSWPVLRALVGWPKIETAEKAAEALRLYCDVESRKDIINKPVALQRYMAMETHYLVASGRMPAP